MQHIIATSNRRIPAFILGQIGFDNREMLSRYARIAQRLAHFRLTLWRADRANNLVILLQKLRDAMQTDETGGACDKYFFHSDLPES